jgi:hypothetical protein
LSGRNKSQTLHHRFPFTVTLRTTDKPTFTSAGHQCEAQLADHGEIEENEFANALVDGASAFFVG